MDDRSIVRGARGIAGLSQAELAAAAGVGRETVAAYERGERNPHPNHIEAIKRALMERGVDFLVHPDGRQCISPRVFLPQAG